MDNNWLTIEEKDGEVILTQCSKDAKGEIKIPEGITIIGAEAFSGCTELTSIEIPYGIKIIRFHAFYGCTKLSKINIPESVTFIYDFLIKGSLFEGCEKLPIENNIRYADTYLVEAVDKELSEYHIKEGTRFIGSKAFSDCKNMSSINIPETVISIGDSVFLNSGLTSITIPMSVTKSGWNPFIGCKELTTITFSEGVERIEEHFLDDCESLTTIVIPNSIKTIEPCAFNYCTSLERIVVKNMTSDGNNFKKGMIKRYAFANCYSLHTITIPNSIEIIEEDAFKVDRREKDKKTLHIPSSVKRIEKQNWTSQFIELDFEGDFPETNNTFEGCEIEKLRINLPRKLAKIPSDIRKAVDKARKGRGGDIIFAAPELCQDKSKVPGYIKVTLTENDELVDINTKYIISVEPAEINRYHPLTGSRITCTSGVEIPWRRDVYEPCEMVLQKIEESLTMLSQQVGGVAGLLNQLETLCQETNSLSLNDKTTSQ